MARITVEDCASKVSNRFDLVLETVERVRQILAGSPVNIARGRDKDSVVALREIATGEVDPQELQESIVRGLQKHVQVDEEEQDVLSILAEEAEWLQGNEHSGEGDVEEEVKEDGLVITDDFDTD